jgi:signal peptidase
MGVRRSLSIAVEAALIIVVFSLVLGVVLGQPVLLSFVETGSMEPTLSPGDGFVAIPAAVAGPVEEGDVVVYEAEETQGGGLTTHRVVSETDRGFVTKGDANPFTDQDGDEPPVRRAQVVAVVWQPCGAVLAIPGVGAVVTGTQGVLETVQRRLAALLGTRSLLGTQGLAYLLLGISAVAYAVDVWRSGDRSRRGRGRSRDPGTSARLLVAVFAGALVLSATATMVVPAGTQEFGVVSADFDSPGVRVIERGTSESTTYILGNGGMVPMITFLEPETEGVEITPQEIRLPAQSSVNATLTLSAPPETGYYRRFVSEHRYLLVLPQPVIRGLYGVHPWLPILAIDAVLGVPFYLLGLALVGTGRIRSRSLERPSRLARLQSLLGFEGKDS